MLSCEKLFKHSLCHVYRMKGVQVNESLDIPVSDQVDGPLELLACIEADQSYVQALELAFNHVSEFPDGSHFG